MPLVSGYGDGEYAAIFEELLKPVALEFNPELILVSAGFDTYEGDPLGGMNVTPLGFAGMTRSVMEIADSCCSGKVVITLEGGYHLQGLRDSVKAVLKELSGMTKTGIDNLLKGADRRMVDYALKPVKEVHRQFWKCL